MPTNRSLIEAKCKREGLNIEFLEYYNHGEKTWILWVEEYAFSGEGEEARTASIPSKLVQEFCNDKNLRNW